MHPLPHEMSEAPALGVGGAGVGTPAYDPSTEVKDVAVDDAFLQLVLSPYVNKQCVYQRAATHSFYEGTRKYRTRATFSIPESCYIDSTGHLNSVELNICYNQMLYVLWADLVRRGRIPALAHWNMEDFKAHQLPGMVIVRLQSEFRRPIDALQFSGDGYIDRVRVTQKSPRLTLFLFTHASFTDANGGLARCEAAFAVF